MLLMTAGGEQHGLVNVIPNSVKTENLEHMKPEMKAKVEKQKKEDNRMVKARYINYRGPFERLDKPYVKYGGDPIRMYHLIPGETYELPMGFVNEVNEFKLPPNRGERIEDGKYISQDTKPDRIHELVPISF